MVHLKAKEKGKLTDPLPGSDTTDEGGSMAMLATLTPSPVAVAPGKARNPQKLEKEDTENEFWQVWCEHRDRLYRCCLRLMNSNHSDAEDALSEAMLKALNMVRKFAGKIANLPAWLMTLTRNLCLDLIRKRSRGAVGVDDIEWVGDSGEMGVASAVELPEQVLERDERSVVIRRAIASLPERMRETFILHFYEELSYQEIVERQGISYDCVYKRISQARKKLKEMLSRYFVDFDESVLGTERELGDANESRQKQEDLAKVSVQEISATPEVSGEEEKREELEVVSADIASQNSQGLETMAVLTSEECVEVDVAEKSELVDGVGSSKAIVEEKIGDGANVCGENVLSPIMPVVLSSLMRDVTWTGCREAAFYEWWRKGLMCLCNGGGILTNIVLRHSWIVQNCLSRRRDQIGMERKEAIANKLSPHIKVRMRRFDGDWTHLEKAEEQLRIASEFLYSHSNICEGELRLRGEVIAKKKSEIPWRDRSIYRTR
ncbi:MAG: sigma-70 family RNA polymerase sigma factor [Okeania sp. SIO2C9]|uniref:RNA polymerase sigma factor n=1 Tax=Okeania sp. SIO2C9 TaxID=2607791 RepID=UPI0013C0BD5E|nr:sigma-70 family RNA polymerase sigma factor [Okeania sp. SIO2C9]NEQ77872.1 sigma-70 family RNA polymerase sigma factor [Okeania sp. SIO2C9]